MSANIICILIAIVVYLAGMVAIGVYYSKGQSDTHEFYLGGRKLGPIVTALSTEASDMSAYLLMGVPGLAFFCGVAEASWTAIGLAIGTYLNWLFVAKRLRRYSVRLGALTLPEYISKRFYDDTKLIELLGAITIIVFYVPYTASGFSACGKLFGTLFGFDYVPTMIISAAVIVAYTACGGFKAASVTSLVQSLIMVFALAVVLIFGINSVGGWDNVVANAKAIPGYLSFTSVTDITASTAGEFGTLKIISTLAWALGYFGMPHVILHFMAIEDENKLKLSRRVATIWVVVSLSVAVIIGIVGYSMAKESIVTMFPDASSAESLIVTIAAVMSEYGAFFAILAGLVLAGILAATMSTADVQLLAAASAIAQNIIRGVMGIKMSDKQSMVVARITVLCVAVCGVLFALDPTSSIFRVVSFAWAGFGATFGPIVLLALFWRRSNKYGAFFGMISGGIMVFVWKYAVRPIGGAWNIYELLPAFIVAILVNVIVSLLTPAPEKEITDVFDEMKKIG